MSETKEDQNQYFPYVCKASMSNQHQILTLSSTPSFILFNLFHSLLSLSLPLTHSRGLTLIFVLRRLIDPAKASYKCFMDDMPFYFRQLHADCKRVEEKTVTTAIHIWILRYICCKTIYFLVLLFSFCCFGLGSLSPSHSILSILHKLNRLFVLSDFKCRWLERARARERERKDARRKEQKEGK